MRCWPGHDPARQLLLAAVGAAVVLVVGCRPRALAQFQIAFPRPAPGALRSGRRIGHLALALVGPALCVAATAAYLAGSAVEVLVSLSLAALVPLALLGGRERSRAAAWRLSPKGPAPDRAALWLAAPAVMWWVLLVMIGYLREGTLSRDLGGFGLPWLNNRAGLALGTALVVGLGEEYLFRGLLFAAAVGVRLERGGFLLVSFSFAAWHIPDAWDGGALAVAGTVLAMFAVSHAVFVPLRLRCRSLGGPALLHAAHNVAMNLM